MRSEKEPLSLVMEQHGIEWEDKVTHDNHRSALDYKKKQRTKEIAAFETVKAAKESQVESPERRLKALAPAVKNMARLAADRRAPSPTGRKKPSFCRTKSSRCCPPCIWSMWRCGENLSLCGE